MYIKHIVFCIRKKKLTLIFMVRRIDSWTVILVVIMYLVSPLVSSIFLSVSGKIMGLYGESIMSGTRRNHPANSLCWTADRAGLCLIPATLLLSIRELIIRMPNCLKLIPLPPFWEKSLFVTIFMASAEYMSEYKTPNPSCKLLTSLTPSNECRAKSICKAVKKISHTHKTINYIHN